MNQQSNQSTTSKRYLRNDIILIASLLVILSIVGLCFMFIAYFTGNDTIDNMPYSKLIEHMYSENVKKVVTYNENQAEVTLNDDSKFDEIRKYKQLFDCY